MRVILGSMLVLLAGNCLAGSYVNLSTPGALDRLEREKPLHHSLITRVIRTVQERSCHEAAAIYRASFDDGIRCPGNIFLTSYPPQLHLSLLLEGTAYTVNVPVRVYARRMPAE